jgi:hypothetical protein
MPAISKPGPSLFLGIELGIDQLRASIVDDTLELVGVECVDFDSELPEYKYAYPTVLLLTLTVTPLIGHRVEFSRHLEKLTRHPSRCGSRDLVSLAFTFAPPTFCYILSGTNSPDLETY